MYLSKVFACICTLLCLFTAMQPFIKHQPQTGLNVILCKLHIPAGILLIVTGIIHGVLAGNPPTATLADFQPAAVLFTLNWGTICILCSILLGVTYLFRKQLKNKWKPAHRLSTAALIVSLVIHLMSCRIA